MRKIGCPFHLMSACLSFCAILTIISSLFFQITPSISDPYVLLRFTVHLFQTTLQDLWNIHHHILQFILHPLHIILLHLQIILQLIHQFILQYGGDSSSKFLYFLLGIFFKSWIYPCASRH